jgi:hypothetical protein
MECLPVQTRAARVQWSEGWCASAAKCTPLERQLKAALFDLDATVNDPKEGIARCIAHALKKRECKGAFFRRTD